jgi:lipooligosaccharide transport system permease protein
MSLMRAMHVAERNYVSYRRNWHLVATGAVEPFLYLLSIGIGVGALVGTVPVSGREVEYQAFVAPGLLAASAMNGAIFDATFNFFFKIKYAHTFDAMLATPLGVGDVALGEMGWSLARSTVYAGAFLLTMAAFGLVESWWGVLALPAATLIGLAFSGVGMAATTYMRSFVHFDFVGLVMVPLFLFSATFFPITRYPEALQVVVRASPLYQGVALERGLILGDLSWALLGHALYLVVLGAVAVRVTSRQLGRMLLP